MTLVPEHDARILIDGTKIVGETNLTQGAMITIGKSYYLRFNNPAEAQQIRTAMGSSERISMPQIDFSQGGGGGGIQRNSTKSSDSGEGGGSGLEIESFYETTIQPAATRQAAGTNNNHNLSNNNKAKSINMYKNLPPIDINGLQCPKVFTADLVTVNLPAEDVLGQKYQRFAKNMAATETQRNEKNINNARRNQNQSKNNNNIISNNNNNIYDNVPMSSPSRELQHQQHPDKTLNSEFYSGKSKNYNDTHQRQALNAYDRYPKLGNLQIFPMNSINSEMNTTATTTSPAVVNNSCSTPLSVYNRLDGSRDTEQNNHLVISNNEREHLDDMLKICSEYTDRQNQNLSGAGGGSNNLTPSPIVQNRIITNGSLPRERKSPFQHDMQKSSDGGGSFSNLSSTALAGDNEGSSYSSSGYENVRVLGPKRVEINGQQKIDNNCAGENYENVVVGKYVPQSPRTKIRTTCMSPKKEQSFSAIFAQKAEPQAQTRSNVVNRRQMEYDELLKTFGEKLEIEMQAIEESSRCYQQPPSSGPSSATHSPNPRTNKNVHNLKLNLRMPSSLQNSPKLNKKPAPAPRTLIKSSANGGSLPHLSVASNSSSAAGSCASINKVCLKKECLRQGFQILICITCSNCSPTIP